MVTSAFVSLWGQRIGAIVWNPATGVGSFEFDPLAFGTDLDPSPIKMPIGTGRGRVFSFPELRASKTFKGLPGLVADVLPDRYGNALINAWLASQGRAADSLNPVELLCFVGNRGMGALEFHPAAPAWSDSSSRLEMADLVDTAEAILSGRKNFSAQLGNNEQVMADILRVGTSAGGARAKAVIAFNPSTGEVRSGQAEAPKGFSHWLIKFDGVHDQQFGTSSGYGRVELAYHRMAVEAGISMTECRLLEENGRAHFMTKRFDRKEGGDKLHVQTFCALRHFDFNEVNLFSYEQLFETMRMLRLPYTQAEEMFRRMAFNVMARNCDDHTKNFAFAMDRQGRWSLAPAYDVCHAYRSGSPWVSQHALSVNGKRTEIARADLLEVGRKMNVKRAESVIDRVAQAVSQWPHQADRVGVEPKLKGAIGDTLRMV